MRELIFLRSKDVKNLMKRLEDQWGSDFFCFFEKFAFFKNKEKIYLISRDIAKVPFDMLRINSAGLYIIEDKNDELRLSVEGSQLLGPKAKKNVIELDDSEIVDLLKGSDIVKADSNEGFVIIKYKDDFFGSAKFKDGRLLNFLPKIRRLSDVNL
jgi:NOL1/NOP2/fmu family ribosome biogenesis protein